MSIFVADKCPISHGSTGCALHHVKARLPHKVADILAPLLNHRSAGDPPLQVHGPTASEFQAGCFNLAVRLRISPSQVLSAIQLVDLQRQASFSEHGLLRQREILIDSVCTHGRASAYAVIGPLPFPLPSRKHLEEGLSMVKTHCQGACYYPESRIPVTAPLFQCPPSPVIWLGLAARSIGPQFDLAAGFPESCNGIIGLRTFDQSDKPSLTQFHCMGFYSGEGEDLRPACQVVYCVTGSKSEPFREPTGHGRPGGYFLGSIFLPENLGRELILRVKEDLNLPREIFQRMLPDLWKHRVEPVIPKNERRIISPNLDRTWLRIASHFTGETSVDGYGKIVGVSKEDGIEIVDVAHPV